MRSPVGAQAMDRNIRGDFICDSCPVIKSPTQIWPCESRHAKRAGDVRLKENARIGSEDDGRTKRERGCVCFCSNRLQENIEICDVESQAARSRSSDERTKCVRFG